MMDFLFNEITNKLRQGWVVNICFSEEEIWLYAENTITDEMMEQSLNSKLSYEDQIRDFFGRLIEKYHISATC